MVQIIFIAKATHNTLGVFAYINDTKKVASALPASRQRAYSLSVFTLRNISNDIRFNNQISIISLLLGWSGAIKV